MKDRRLPEDQHLKKFFLGVNYWPGKTGVQMWSRWNPEQIRVDLTRMTELGMNAHRSFLFLPDFLPTPHETNPLMLERFLQYLALCEEIGIGTFPSFFVGHMSGEDWDIPWRDGKNFYTDPELLKVEERYITDVVIAAQNSPAILGWVLSNEIPVFEPRGTEKEVVAWAGRMIQAIRNQDGDHPVSIGDGCWAPEVSRRAFNFPLRYLAPMQDFLGLHFYPRSGNPWRQSFTAAFRLQMAAAWGKPVIIEEFGHSTTMGSEENQAHYYRTTLYSSLVNGAKGAFNWCFSDFELWDTRPYNHHPFEMRFGLVQSNGDLKPAAKEIRAFSTDCHDLYSGEWEPGREPRVGLVIPRPYYQIQPIDWDSDFSEWYPLYLNVFSDLKRANLLVQSIFEPAGDSECPEDEHHLLELNPAINPLLVLPRLKRITAPFWRQILQFVHSGGHLYTSFSHDHWIVDWEETFGITSDVRFGLPTTPAADEISLSIISDWLREKVGDGFTIPIKDMSVETAYCPVITQTAEVLIEDQDQNPVLLYQPFGKGGLYYSLFPLEMMLLKAGDHPANAFWGRILGAIWNQVTELPDVSVGGQDLEWGIWRNIATDDVKLVVVNHAWDKRRGSVHLAQGSGGVLSANVPTTKSEAGIIEFELDRKAILIGHLRATSPNGKISVPGIGTHDTRRADKLRQTELCLQ
ncbi:MAG: cellulase family glycosylhydrolase [Candidatus Marinimicrobia bacterium]|nr:cellulase family glycosylhydrolase [Candidatus Neomarinimicrobiota bacterium]